MIRNRGVGSFRVSGGRNGHAKYRSIGKRSKFRIQTHQFSQCHWGEMIGGERENWAKECSSIIDTCFNGGGVGSFCRMSSYVEYLKSFYPNAKLFKKGWTGVGICFLGTNKDGRP